MQNNGQVVVFFLGSIDWMVERETLGLRRHRWNTDWTSGEKEADRTCVENLQNSLRYLLY